MVRNSRGIKLMLSGLCWLIASCQGQSGGQDNSYLNLAVTDAPVDFAVQVVVQFSGVEIKSGKQVITLRFCEDPANPALTMVSTGTCVKSKPAVIDLLAMHSGSSAPLLSRYPLSAGHYDAVRLLVDAAAGVVDSYIVLGPDRTNPKLELDLPSDAEAGLILSGGFDVFVGGTRDLIIDFNLRKSVRQEGAGIYKMRPVLRMVDKSKIGAIVGEVFGTDPALTATTCFSSVYIYSGWNAVPGDIGSSTGPLTSATINVVRDGSGYHYPYRAAFLEAGNYTVAYTCEANKDDPAVDDDITFLRTANVTVSAGVEGNHNFE